MIYCFGDFECDETRHELRQAGHVVPIEPKVFEVLRYFLAHPDRVVTKDELLDHCWSNTFVTEAALTRCLTKLRKIVHSGPSTQPVIKTVPRQGYRFVAALTTQAPEPVADTGDTAVAPDTASSPAPLSVGQSASPESLTAPSTNQNEPEPVVSAEQPSPVAERRQLTVLFCDVVGSTSLAEQLDPEHLHEVLQAYHAVCTEIIERFDGYVAQYLGDGLLVYFGYPQAHEDAARRAVHTGLGIVRAISELNRRPERLHGVHVAVRIGIHTGLVMMGDVGTQNRVEQLAVGATPNIASRLQGLTTADTVLVSDETFQLVQGYFTYEAMGTYTLTGVATPTAVYRILEESGAQTRLEAVTTQSLTPFVGRETELSWLQERWGQVQQGMGHVVILNGEAGIGKSRLVQALYEGLADVAHTRLECRCSPYHQHSVLYPVIDLLHRLLHADGEYTEDDTIQRLERLLLQCRLAVQESVTLLAPLLALPLPADRYAPLQLSPQQQRQRTLETLLAMVLALADQQPVLLIMEDVHWVDPSTLEWLGWLLDQGPTAPILTLMTCRPIFQSPWSGRAHVTSLTLHRLPRQQVEQMVQAIVGAETVPTELVEQVVTTTDGVPLFVEEVTKLVIASAQHATDGRSDADASAKLAVTIPTTLQDSLMARLDAVGVAKQTAQLGATIGRHFSHSLLQSVSALNATTLQQHLGTLVAADLLYQRGVGLQTTYVFKHALIQDAAYQSLLRRTRQGYHQHIAEALAERFLETAEGQPELLAHHYTEAGLTEPAIGYWHRAGQQAIARSAHSEAIAHLTTGLTLLQTLPETPERLQQELRLQITLGRSLIVTQGYGSPDVEHAYARARTLCNQLGETSQLIRVLLGLWTFYYTQAELQTARELAEQVWRLVQRVQDRHHLVQAHLARGQTAYNQGELVQARQHLEQGLAIYDGQHSSTGSVQNPGVGCCSFLSYVLWVLGYPDQAVQRSNEAVARARKLSHPFSLAIALDTNGDIHRERGEQFAAQELWEAMMALAREQGYPYFVAMFTVQRGRRLVEQGQTEEGIAQIRQSLADLRPVGGELSRSGSLYLLAEAYQQAGQTAEGLTVLAEALGQIQHTGHHLWEAELYRRKGELLRTLSAEHQTETEACFLHALDVSRRQHAKTWELRAAISLARLWQQQGKRQDAYDLLAPVYGWFTEGFDTADLQEAKSLLEALSS